MLRVLQVIAPASFGGAESVVWHLSEALLRAGCEVLVVPLAVRTADHPWVTQVRAAGVPVASVPPRGVTLLHEPRALRALARRFRADVVHSHGYRPDIITRLAGGGRRPWVSTVHGFTSVSARVHVYAAVDMLALRRAATVVAVADRVRTQLRGRGIADRRIRVIRNVPPGRDPVDRAAARMALGLDATDRVMGWVGRFSHEKGPDRLVDLVRRLRTPATLVLVGDGPVRAEVMAALDAVDGPVRARWIGARDDIGRYMRAFDVVLLPSRTEGMPMVVLEAMASGVPVAGFDVGDVPHVVDASTGWLVAEGDVAALAVGVEDALRHPDRTAHKGATAAARVAADFSSEAWAAAHCACYEEAARHGGWG